MGYYLLEHRNPNGDHFYTSRRKRLRVIVLHITAGLEDLDLRGDDVSAEQTARYAASTSRYVSWHAGADSDTYLYLLPPSYTAWHVRNYNSGSWGLEISKRDTTWSDEPDAWVEATLSNAADACRPIAEKYDIPLRLLTKKQVDAGRSGFVYHSTLDPGRRTDPGKDFPIKKFFRLLQEVDDMDDDKFIELARQAVREETKAIYAETANRGKNVSIYGRTVGDDMNETLKKGGLLAAIRAGQIDVDQLAEKIREHLGGNADAAQVRAAVDAGIRDVLGSLDEED